MYQTQYEEELEINDFPQSCRWKVTSREAIGNITDFSEADIQIRGVYYPPGKEPGEGMFKNITCQKTIIEFGPILTHRESCLWWGAVTKTCWAKIFCARKLKATSHYLVANTEPGQFSDFSDSKLG